MLPDDRDTIAAVATPAGVGGVGIVRLSGPRAAEILASVTGRDQAAFRDRQLVHAVVRNRAGDRIDDVLAVVMRGPRSFTGEDVAELHGHGGVVNMARLLRVVLELGARQAEPGEFTRRAFENDKIDLVRAEAIAGVIEAGSDRAWRVAQAQLAGSLGDRVRAMRAAGTELLAEVEACIDFPEEDNDYIERAGVKHRAKKLAAECSALAATFDVGRLLRDGIEVALVGPVNSGKSSLFNRLVDSERALVAPEPGTTRDYVEARRLWRGVTITFIDTAGERDAEASIEQRGIELGQRRARQVDLRLRLHPVTAGPAPAAAAGELLVLSMADRADSPPDPTEPQIESPDPQPGALGSPRSQPGALGSARSQPGALGSPGSQPGSLGSPGSQAGSLGPVGSQAGALGSSGSQAGALGSSGSQAGALGSSGSQAGALGSVRSQPGALGSPGLQAGALGSSGSQAGSPGSVGSQAGSPGSVGSQAGSPGSVGSQAGSPGSVGSQAGALGSSGSQAGALGSSGSQAGALGSSGSQAGSPGSVGSQAGALLLTSAVTGAGVESLLDAVVERVAGTQVEADDGAIVTSERQRALLDRAASAYQRAELAARDGIPTEMLALEVREGTAALAEILGEAIGEEVLDALFARFCIGK